MLPKSLPTHTEHIPLEQRFSDPQSNLPSAKSVSEPQEHIDETPSGSVAKAALSKKASLERERWSRINSPDVTGAGPIQAEMRSEEPISTASNIHAAEAVEHTPTGADQERPPSITAKEWKQGLAKQEKILTGLQKPLQGALSNDYVRSYPQLRAQMAVIRAIDELVCVAKTPQAITCNAEIERALQGRDERSGNASSASRKKLSVASTGNVDSKNYHYEKKAAGWAVAAMVAKNFLVWDGPRFLDKLIESHVSEGALIGINIGTSFVAGLAEYYCQHEAHEAWKKTGGTLPGALAGVLGVDIALAILAAKAVGDDVEWRDGLNLAMTVAGAAIGAEVVDIEAGLNKTGLKKKKPPTPIFTNQNEEAAAANQQDDLERGGAPRGKTARKAAANIKRLVDNFPEERQTLCLMALKGFKEQERQLLEDANSKAINLSPETVSYLRTRQEKLSKIVGTEDNAEENKIKVVIDHLKELKESELDKNGGKDKAKMAFYGALGISYIGMLAANAGVGRYDNKAILNTIASTVPQMPANLLPAAISADNTIPLGFTELKTSRVAATLTTLLEFGPLQYGFSCADVYNKISNLAKTYAVDLTTLINQSPTLSEEDLDKKLEDFNVKAQQLTEQSDNKVPQVTDLANRIAANVTDLRANLHGEQSGQIINDLAGLLEKLADAGQGKPNLIPNARSFQELLRAALQLAFSSIELKQNLMLKDYVALGLPGLVSLLTHAIPQNAVNAGYVPVNVTKVGGSMNDVN